MQQKLNSKKTFKDNWLLVVCWMIIAYVMMLLPLCWDNKEVIVEDEEDVSEIEMFPIWHMDVIPSDTELKNSEWYPWELNSSWDSQEMPVLISTESHQRFIELAEKYNLPADVIWHTENYYWLKEWTIICIAIAETSWWKPWTYGEEWCWNYGNVGNNDRGNRRCFPNQWAWLAAIGQTLMNDNLKNNKTIACLNWAWECIEQGASWKRYSTWKSWNRQRNMIWCFHSIYQTPINPKTFNLHDR